MRNKFKIIAVVAAVIVGMVVYKTHFDKTEKKNSKDKSSDDMN